MQEIMMEKVLLRMINQFLQSIINRKGIVIPEVKSKVKRY